MYALVGAVKTRPTGPPSTSAPLRMTTTSSANALDERQVVGDEEVGDAVVLLDVAHQVEDLGPERHVEGGDRFVAHDQLGLERQRARDRDPLQLAAGQLASGSGRAWRRRGRPAPAAGRLVSRSARFIAEVHPQRLGDRLDRSGAGVERAVRILEDHLHPPPQRRAARRRSSARTSVPSKRIVPPSGSIRRSTRRPVVDLPAPDSPTSASVSPALERERHVVDRREPLGRADQPPRGAKRFVEALDLEQASS